MKRKLLALVISLILAVPTVLFAEEEPLKGTIDNPFYSSLAEEGTTEFRATNSDFSNIATANITVSVVGQLTVTPAYEKISELAYIDARGPMYFCYKVLLKAEDMKDGKAILITAKAFKVFDTKKMEVPILTEYEIVELLNGTGVYMYIGFRTSKGTFPLYIVFNNELWFDLISAPYIDE